jgi:hypothetical protein
MALQPYQSKVPIGRVLPDGSVMASEAFIRYISLYLFNRVGGVDAMNNTELTALAESIRGNAEAQGRQALQVAQRPPRGGYGIDVTQDALGATISVAVEELISGILPYIPRPASVAQRGVDDVGSIIATQVFGAR